MRERIEVVFNIKGNQYRIVVRINYPARIVFIQFIGTHEAPQNRNFMAGYRKTAVAVNPAIGIGCTPGGFFINASKSFWDEAPFFMFFMPGGALGPVHYLIGADDPITAPVQETFEK